MRAGVFYAYCITSVNFPRKITTFTVISLLNFRNKFHKQDDVKVILNVYFWLWSNTLLANVGQWCLNNNTAFLGSQGFLFAIDFFSHYQEFNLNERQELHHRFLFKQLENLFLNCASGVMVFAKTGAFLAFLKM